MGRGDKRSKKGKIAIGSYGNSRRKKEPGYKPETAKTEEKPETAKK
jgi:ribosomal small subunit protein bTHX